MSLADGIVFNSETVAADTRSTFRAMKAKPSRVVYWGVGPGVKRIDEAEAAVLVKEALGVAQPYLLYVGALTRFKNIDGLLRMFSGVRAARPDLSLVLVGREDWPRYARAEALGGEGVVRVAWADDETLGALYSACLAFVTLSWYEGFGLPIAEAMACGAPVVVNNGGALAEVVGDAGLVVPGADVSAATSAVLRLVEDEGLRARQREAALRRAKCFDWGAAARGIVSLTTEVLA
jgi:glycosyltransferase involved in cell wall biosynthesis